MQLYPGLYSDLESDGVSASTDTKTSCKRERKLGKLLICAQEKLINKLCILGYWVRGTTDSILLTQLPAYPGQQCYHSHTESTEEADAAQDDGARRGQAGAAGV